MKQYAGRYIIGVQGYNSNQATEGYVLSEDGTAQWMYIENDGRNGAHLTSKKYGTWNAHSGELTVTIKGNTSAISETYQIIGETFTNTTNPNRYLKEN